MTDDLIDRIRAAKGPSRELDAFIAVAVFSKPSPPDDLIYAYPIRKNDQCEPGTYWRKSRSGASLQTAPAFTSSLDAAMSLVPEGYTWMMTNNHYQHEGNISGTSMGSFKHVGPWVGIRNKFSSHLSADYEGIGATPALALIIAALEARKGMRG